MWIEEGFSPDLFWAQTGRSFQIAVEARFEARKAEARDDTRRAWQIANFAGASFGGKLQDLDHYLPTEGGEKPQSVAALFGFLMKMRRKGLPMTVERIERAA